MFNPKMILTSVISRYASDRVVVRLLDSIAQMVRASSGGVISSSLIWVDNGEVAKLVARARLRIWWLRP